MSPRFPRANEGERSEVFSEADDFITPEAGPQYSVPVGETLQACWM